MADRGRAPGRALEHLGERARRRARVGSARVDQERVQCLTPPKNPLWAVYTALAASVYTGGMDLKMISLKVPAEMLVRIDREAEREGLSRTGLLLRPWGDAPKTRTAARSQEGKREVAARAAAEAARVTGVQVGPIVPPPGSRLKQPKGRK